MKETLNAIKQKVMLSPMAVPAKRIEAFLQKKQLHKANDRILANGTVYCISPYKTGTTFIASCFNGQIAAHEPLQYLSLKELSVDFNNFFLRRLNTLNLKLECSGFLSGYVEELATHSVAKELTYLCVTRKPTSWVTSVINYWGRSQYVMKRYDFINELFWIPKAGVDLKDFFSMKEEAQEVAIHKLLHFYMDFTKKTEQLQNLIYMPLNKLDSHMASIGEIINEPPSISKAWKRKNNNKMFNYENQKVDAEYELLISTLQSRRQDKDFRKQFT